MNDSIPLPSPKNDKLPPLPPPVTPPLPPPKLLLSSQETSPSSQTLVLPPSTSNGGGLTAPRSPVTPTSLSAPDPKPKKANPLTDLVESEKAFVEQLTGIIRKVAAAWSRSNLPPPELDAMFRSIEGIYKANRGLYAKLKDISADPKSAGELGGLLIKWVDDLKKAYETYCNKYCSGFDTWQPVQSNPRLGPILVQFSSTNPAPSKSGIWTLDSLFLLPKNRLKYYLKLYSRLLKNTDNRLLVNAVETLNILMDILESRNSLRVGEQELETPFAPLVVTEDEVVIDMQSQTLNSPVAAPSLENNAKTGSETSSNQGSRSERSSRESESTSISNTSTRTLSIPISDLERRLSTNRTLDIFTMTPKSVKLQISPPSLTFTRELRVSLNVIIRFTPSATGAEIIHRRGHIFLLSDLFLVCERVSPEDRKHSEGADMWLCYPPLAGKVLRASEVNGRDTTIQVAIMRKEFLMLETDTPEARTSLLAHFMDCIEFSTSLLPPSKIPPPPLPALNVYPRLRSDGTSSPNTPAVEARSAHIRPVGQQSSSSNPEPLNQNENAPEQPPPAYQIPESRSVSDRSDTYISSQPTQPFLRPSMSAQPFPRGPSFGPTNMLPPARSTNFIPSNNDTSAGPSFVPQNAHYGAMPSATNNFLSNQTMYPLNPNVRSQSQYIQGDFPSRPPSDQSIGANARATPPQRSQYFQLDASGRTSPFPNTGPPINGINQIPQNNSYTSPFPNTGPPINGVNQMPRNNSYTPPFPNAGPPINGVNQMPRNKSYAGGLHVDHARPFLPSAQLGARSVSMAEIQFNEPSPPSSPIQQPQMLGPTTSTISAQMKCKVFLQQHHSQWKSLGSAKLKLYHQEPTNIKQLVVEAENKEKAVLISTIVLTDGVERVGKTGVAIELSDKGARTGIVYMIQLRNETSAGGLFDSLLAGSDRAIRG